MAIEDKLVAIRNKIILSDTDPNKGICLSLYSGDPWKIEVFKGLGYLNLPKDLGWFHQCNGQDYQMFEFWKPNLLPMMEIAGRIAKEMDLPIRVELTTHLPRLLGKTPFDLEAFKPFDAKFHTFGDFFGRSPDT